MAAAVAGILLKFRRDGDANYIHADTQMHMQAKLALFYAPLLMHALVTE